MPYQHAGNDAVLMLNPRTRRCSVIRTACRAAQRSDRSRRSGQPEDVFRILGEVSATEDSVDETRRAQR